MHAELAGEKAMKEHINREVEHTPLCTARDFALFSRQINRSFGREKTVDDRRYNTENR